MDLESELLRLCVAAARSANDNVTFDFERHDVVSTWSPMPFGRPESPIAGLTEEIDEFELEWKRKQAA